MISSFIHFPTNNIILFFIDKQCSIIYTHHIVLMHSLGRYLGCVYSLALVNGAAVNMDEPCLDSMLTYTPSSMCPGMVEQDQTAVLLYSFWGPSILISIKADLMNILFIHVWGWLLMHFLTSICCFLDGCHSDWTRWVDCKCHLNLHFLYEEGHWAISSHWLFEPLPLRTANLFPHLLTILFFLLVFYIFGY
jgi:hypothetical protein